MEAEVHVDHRSTALRVAAVLLILVVGIGVLVLVGRGTPKSCAGQCSAPYQLDVTFHQGVTASAATSRVHLCAGDAEVISVGVGSPALGGMTVPVYTHDFGGAKTAPLFSCLRALPAVTTVGYPD